MTSAFVVAALAGFESARSKDKFLALRHVMSTENANKTPKAITPLLGGGTPSSDPVEIVGLTVQSYSDGCKPH